MASAASTPMIATTIINSISVKPCCTARTVVGFIRDPKKRANGMPALGCELGHHAEAGGGATVQNWKFKSETANDREVQGIGGRICWLSGNVA